jgi:hypothetical protein
VLVAISKASSATNFLICALHGGASYRLRPTYRLTGAPLKTSVVQLSTAATPGS